MFTIADIRHIAIQIEKNGEETYRKAAMEAGESEIGQILGKMADDEKRHAEWFERLRANRELTEEQREMEAVGKTILQEMVKDKTFSLEQSTLGQSDGLAELLSTSQAFEKDTILFYEMLQGFVDDEETARQLEKIIAEEKRHVDDIHQLLKKYTARA
jgi:rubrerythrin